MAILFDGQARTITLTVPGDISVRAIWTAYIDWLVEGDNSKHLPMLATVGMDSPDIPLYLFLKNGVIFIVLDNSAPTVLYDGTIKTYDGHEPFGGAIVNVRYRDPGIAIGYSTTGGTGPSVASIAAASAAAVLAALNATTGARTVGQHLQIQTAVLAGVEAGAGTTHISFTDNAVVVEADVPLPGQVGNRTNVVISGV